MSSSPLPGRIAVVIAIVAIVAAVLSLFRGAEDSGAAARRDAASASAPTTIASAPAVRESNGPDRRAAESDGGAVVAAPREPRAATVRITARVTDRSGRPLDRRELDLLLPNRDPFSSQMDDTPARSPSRLLSIAEGQEEADEVDFFLIQPRGGALGLWFSLPERFVGKLILVVHGEVADRVDYRVGDPDLEFRVDIDAVRAQLATLRIGVAESAGVEDFIVRVESSALERGIRENEGGTPGFSLRIDRRGRAVDARRGGERRSFDGKPIVLTSLRPGVYKIAARCDDAAFEPAVVTLGANEDRSVTLAAVPRCDVTVRVWPATGAKLPEIGTPEIRVGSQGVMFPEQNGICDRRVVPAGGGQQFVEFRFRGLPPGPLAFLVSTHSFMAALAPGDNGAIDLRLLDDPK